MGHPIDPGDPTNGGCPLCYQYLPEFLDASYTVYAGATYTGFIQRLVLDPNVWSGFIRDHLGNPKLCQISFCSLGSDDGRVAFTGRQQTFLEDLHCNTPVAGSNPQGDTFLFTVDQPDP